MKDCILKEYGKNNISPENTQLLFDIIDIFSFFFVPTGRHECFRKYRDWRANWPASRILKSYTYKEWKLVNAKVVDFQVKVS